MKKTIRELDLKGKRVLIRVDFNVPLDDSLKITDDTRIRESLPTIQYALDKGARKVILMSHLGRPKGKPESKYSLKPVADHLAKLIKKSVIQAPDCVGETADKAVSSASEPAVVLLENLRFHAEEEKNDSGFAKLLAKHADLYVNDAFGTSHRAHASVDAVARLLPSAAGFLLEKEIRYLGEAVKNPRKPFVTIMGGSKVSDKIGMIENLIDKVDAIIIGGAMAYTFMKAQGERVGKSRVEADKLELAGVILKKASDKKVRLLFPVDHVVVKEVKETAATQIVRVIGDDDIAVDIGPQTIKLFAAEISKAKTVIWNGPMGIFEMKPFSSGSRGICEALGALKDAVTIIGGGDTAACVVQLGYKDKVSHISTGGGASLEYLEGRPLPGIEVLS